MLCRDCFINWFLWSVIINLRSNQTGNERNQFTQQSQQFLKLHTEHNQKLMHSLKTINWTQDAKSTADSDEFSCRLLLLFPLASCATTASQRPWRQRFKKTTKKTTDKSPRGYRASLSQSSRNRWHQPMKIRYRKHQPMKTRNMRKITDDPGGTEPSVFFFKTARGVLKQNRRKPKALANENTR